MWINAPRICARAFFYQGKVKGKIMEICYLIIQLILVVPIFIFAILERKERRQILNLLDEIEVNLDNSIEKKFLIIPSTQPFLDEKKLKKSLSLTESGLKVLVESGGKKFIDDNKDKLLKYIFDQNPPTLLDIQELSKDSLLSEKGNQEFIPIKEYVYNGGLIFDDVIKALSLYLRDLALNEWKKSETN